LLSLKVVAGMVKTIKIRPENMLKSVDRGYLLATDLADYLVKKGETFRNAHGIVGRLVSHCVKEGKTFLELPLDEYRRFSPLFDPDVFEITVATSIDSRNVPGGTARNQVEKALAVAKAALGVI
jgi:argininosuccinate lyase